MLVVLGPPPSSFASFESSTARSCCSEPSFGHGGRPASAFPITDEKREAPIAAETSLESAGREPGLGAVAVSASCCT